jgi:hypothetical protein
MTSTRQVQGLGTRLLFAIATLAVGTIEARAAEVWLQAGAASFTPPGGGAPIAMWGYASCAANFTSCGTPTAPGPALEVPAADPGLTVHLQNTLPEPTSLVIPGQVTAMTPVWAEPDGSGAYSGSRPPGNLTARVRSFTHEAAPGGSAVYDWPTLQPGTYLYESGTHPQVQVQMGLYGAVTKDAAAATSTTPAEAYPGVPYAQAVTLLYSEVDPVLHQAVASGTYGTPAGPTSTFDYNPRYFLVNGEPYQAGAPPAATVAGGTRTLLRFLNAGLRTHVPMALGQHLELIAEDGKPYPWPDHPRRQATIQLAAAKTTDAILAVDNPGVVTERIAILDRKLDVTNAGAPDGGLISFVDVTTGTAASAPIITSAPPPTGTVGVPYAYQVTAADPNPGDTLTFSLDLFPPGMSISGAGLVAWTPTATGSFQVTVRVADQGGLFATQAYSVAVAAPNSPPVARNDGPYTMVEGGTLSVAAPGVLGNDTDVDGGLLTAVNYSAAPIGTLTGSPGGSFTWSFPMGSAGTRSFTYQARDPALALSNVATATVGVLANRPPTVVDDTFSARRRTNANSGGYGTVTLTVLANDSDPDTVLDPANAIAPSTVVVTVRPTQGGTATVNANGTLSYVPRINFKGTDTLKYRVRDTRSALSIEATVRINVK